MLPQISRHRLHGHPVDARTAAVALYAPQGREEVPSLHHLLHQTLFAHRSAPSPCANRRFTPSLRDGPLELLSRCMASVQHPVRPPANRAGLPHAPACLLCPLLTSACRSAPVPLRSVPQGNALDEPHAALPG